MKTRTISNQVSPDEIEQIITDWAASTGSEECEEFAEKMMGYYMLGVAISANCKKMWRDVACVYCVLCDFPWVCPRVEY